MTPGSRLLVALVGCQRIDNRLFQLPGAHRDLVGRQSAQGMGNAQRVEVVAAKGAGVAEGRVQERIGANHHRGDAEVLQRHCVVHTARGAGASISNRGDHEVAPLGELAYDLIGGRTGIDVLVHGDDVAQFQVPGQPLAHVLQQKVGVGLAVAQKPPTLSCSVSNRGAARQRDAASGSMGRAKPSSRHPVLVVRDSHRSLYNSPILDLLSTWDLSRDPAGAPAGQVGRVGSARRHRRRKC